MFHVYTEIVLINLGALKQKLIERENNGGLCCMHKILVRQLTKLSYYLVARIFWCLANKKGC